MQDRADEQKKLILYTLPETETRNILRSIESFFSIHRILISSILLIINAALGSFLTTIIDWAWPLGNSLRPIITGALLLGSIGFGSLGIWVILQLSPPVYRIEQCARCLERRIVQPLPAFEQRSRTFNE